MGFNISHQHVGLNRLGVFLQTARTKGNPTPGPSPFHEEGRRARANEPWRRISDLVGANAETRDPKVRKRCVRKLMAWMKRKCNAASSQRDEAPPAIGIFTAWDGEVGSWRRAACGGRSVESLCVQLGISRGRLTGLTQEAFGLSAGEIMDGFKIAGLKKFLVGQLREAACRLWGVPGSFATFRCHFARRDEGILSREMEEEKMVALRALKGAGGTPAPHMGAPHMHALHSGALHKRSRYFRTRAEEFFGVMAGEEERLRVNELLGMLELHRDENDWRIEAFAMRLGFESAQKFRRACLNVMGRTLEQLERILAHEIVAYYLAAEDRELRTLAMRADELGFRAREIYGDSEEVPREPFLDRWSAHESAKPEWLGKMRGEFG